MLQFNSLFSHHKIFSALNFEDSKIPTIKMYFSVSSCVTF